MESILSHPAVQGGVAPFISAIAIALIFQRINLLAGFAIVAAFSTTVYLTTGFGFEPLNSTRKITLVILLTPLLAIAMQVINPNSDKAGKWLSALSVGTLLWILWPAISRYSPGEMMLAIFAYSLYAGWMVYIFFRMATLSALIPATAMTISGATIGGAALIGASALLGQLGLSLLAAGSAILLIQLLVRNEREAGYSFTLIPGFIAALLLPASIVYAKVPWVILPMAAMIPIFAFYPFEDDRQLWRNTLSVLAIMAVPMGIAFYITWKSAGALLL